MSIHPDDKHLIEAFMGGYFTLYDEDWNTFMKVVQRIEDLWKQYPVVDWKNDKDQYYFLEVVGMPLSTTMESALPNIIKFIKWYNDKTPTP